MHLLYLIIGTKPGFEGEFVCGIYTSLPLARAAVAWTLQPQDPDATFYIREEVSK